MNDPNALLEDFVPCKLSQMLNSKQRLILLRQTQILGRNKYLRKHNKDNFSGILYYLTKEIINQPMFSVSK